MKIQTNYFSVNNESLNDLQMFSFFSAIIGEYFSIYYEYLTVPSKKDSAGIIDEKEKYFEEKVIPILKALKTAVEVNIETWKFKRGLYGISLTMEPRKGNKKTFSFVYKIRGLQVVLVSSNCLELS